MGKLYAVAHRFLVGKALRSGGQLWVGLAAASFGAKLISRMAARSEDVVDRRVLNPGESVLITHTTQSRGEERRAAKHARRS